MAKKKAFEKSIRVKSQSVAVEDSASPVASRRPAERVRPVAKTFDTLATRPVMLLVLGMHRSGGSVVTRLLECLGAVNSSNLKLPVPENIETGFLEDYDIYQFNQIKFLPRLQTTWHNLAQVDWSNLPSAARSKFALEALEILRKNYSSSNPLSVLKERRIGMLLPFWLSVLRHAGYNPKVVCVVRDPASVARSIAKSDGFSIAHGGMLYATQWLSFLSSIQDLPAAFVQFDEVFASPSRVLKSVAERLAIPVPADFDARVIEFSSSFLDPSLRHNSLDRLDLPLEADLPPIAINVYETLITAAQSQNIKKTSKFIASAGQLLSVIQPVLSDFDRVIDELSGEGGVHLSLREEVGGLGGALQKLADAEKTLSFAAVEKSNIEKQISELASQFECLNAENLRLCDVRDALKGSLEALEVEHLAPLAEKKALESENAALSKERDHLIAENTRLDSDAERYASAMDERFRELARLTEEFTALQDALAAERLAADTLSLQTAVDRGQLCEHTTALHKQLEGSLSENAALVSRLGETASERNLFLARESGLKARIASLEAESGVNALRFSQLEAEHATLVDSYSNLSAERDGLAGRLEGLEGELEKSVSEMDILRERILGLEGERDELVGRFAGLEQEHSKLAVGNSQLAAENAELSAERDGLAGRLEGLEGEVRERSSETILLGKRILGIEVERDALGAQLEGVEGELASRISEIDGLRGIILAGEKERDAMSARTESLAAEVQERFYEIVALGKRILYIEAEGAGRAAENQSQIDAMAARWTWKLSAPFRFSWDKARNAAVKISRLSIALRILRKHRHSSFIDPDWYLANNPDVKQSAVQPLRHFAFHGAFEGRAPHASFRERDYISQNPDLASRRKPPLVHYALKGWSQT